MNRETIIRGVVKHLCEKMKSSSWASICLRLSIEGGGGTNVAATT